MRPWMYVVLASPFAVAFLASIATAIFVRRTGPVARAVLVIAAILFGLIAALGILLAIQ